MEAKKAKNDVYQCLLFLLGKNAGIVRNRGQFWIFCSHSRFFSVKTEEILAKSISHRRGDTRRGAANARAGARKKRCL